MTERLMTPVLSARRVGQLFERRWAIACGVALGSLALSIGVLSEALANPLSRSIAQAEVVREIAQEDSAQQAESVNAVSVVEPPADPAPAPTPFAPLLLGITDVSRNVSTIESVGHLRPNNVETAAQDSLAWIQSVNLPLYVTPGGEHWGWIYRGWLIPKGQTYLAIGRDAGFAMVRSYGNLYTFPVLEIREDGWFRVQYTPGGSAWAHTSQLELGNVPLTVESWAERLQAQEAVFFLDNQKAQALRSQPQQSTNMVSLVAADSLIEPLEFQGNWMRVRATRPIANCQPLTGATVSEGWMRWRGEAQESLVWYRPEGGCSK